MAYYSQRYYSIRNCDVKRIEEKKGGKKRVKEDLESREHFFLQSCIAHRRSSWEYQTLKRGVQSRFTPMEFALASIKSRRPLSPSVRSTKTRKRKRHGTRSKPVHAPGEALYAKKNRSLTNEREGKKRTPPWGGGGGDGWES